LLKYMGKMVGAGAEIFDKLEPEPEPKFLTSWSRSRAAQKWTGLATLLRIIGTDQLNTILWFLCLAALIT
jgi:hypothetical protein